MNKSKGSWSGVFDSPMVIALMATIGFYGVIHSPSMSGTILHRYTTEHAVMYVITGFFIWGITEILFRLSTFPRESRAMRAEWLPRRGEGREPTANAAVYLAEIESRPAALRDSRIGRRLIEALRFVAETGSPNGYRDQLLLLSEQDEAQTRDNYALVRFVVWISPVLGFLGTVLFFGKALSNITPEEMATRINSVVNQMGAAFNTTTIALTSAVTMMFCVFLCERKERGLLRRIDTYLERELLNRFEVREAAVLPFLNVVQSANEAALGELGRTLERQVQNWTDALGALFVKFDQRQAHEGQAWGQLLEAAQRRQDASEAAREQRFGQMLTAVESRQEKHFTQLYTMVEKIVALRQDFSGFVAALKELATGEEKLVGIQSSLADNLQLLHQTQHIDEALHGLTAAIHLLTVRHRVVGGPESAAA
jgi:biopolymer transport protein ExbB/TolQ